MAALLLVVSGLLLTVIQAPIDWWLLAWVAYVPFALACSPQIRFRGLSLVVLAVGYLYWLGNLYWIVPITIIGWFALGLYMSLYWLLLAVGVRFSRARGLPLFIALPILLAGVERLQGFPLGGFFWRFLGHSQYSNLAVIQVADLFGAAGVSFVVAMANGLIADLVLFVCQSRRVGSQPTRSPDRCAQNAGGTTPGHESEASRKPSARILVGGAVATVLIVTGTVLYGQWRLRQAETCVTEGPLVGSLQSNVPQSVKRSFSVSGQLFEELMEKSQAAAQAGAELIVWPETMVQGLLDPGLWPLLEGDLDEDKAFHQALCEHAKDTAHLLVGAYGAQILTDPYGKRYLGSYNSAYFYRPDGTRDPGRYDKIHLVLFGEYIPFKQWCPWLFEQLKKFFPKGYNPDYSLEHGKHYTVFEMNAPAAEPNAPVEALSPYHFAVIICYEDTIPYVARNFALDERGRKRIDWLVNISNDGWFVRFPQDPPRVIPSSELPQHAAICAFRAVENRLAVIRSVNTGISCLIESTGRIRDGYLAASEKFPAEAMDRTAMTGWFLDRLPIDKRVTFYSRHGEWLANICAIAAAVAVVWPLAIRLIRRRKRENAKDRPKHG